MAGLSRYGSALRLFLCLAFVCAPASTVAGDQAAKEAELRTLKRQIAELRERLDQAHDSLTEDEKALRQTEVQIGQLNRRLRTIGRDMRETQTRLDELGKERTALKAELVLQRAALVQHVRAAYLLGRQDYLKLLLNQQAPAKVERMITYYQYLTEARAQQIGAARSRLSRLMALETTIQQEAATLEQLRAQAMERKAQRESQLQRRHQALARLRAEIRSGDLRLVRLQESEKKLEHLIKELRAMFADIPDTLDGRNLFSSRKGQLPWPTKGKVRHTFGTSRSLGDLKWQGVLIAGRTGQLVRAVHRGRVAFADWLRGLGLLVIIEHGDGFMSLYGHNRLLLKEMGDWVVAGEPVATVGDTGGSDEPGLYFEIRSQGEPVNPADWCKRG